MHICQGISIGNIFSSSINEVWNNYDPSSHPIISLLLDGGPLQLAKHNNIHYQDTYADACHMCYEVRKSIRDNFPDILLPNQMYGVFN